MRFTPYCRICRIRPGISATSGRAVLQLLDMASDAPELTVSWDELLEASTRHQYQLRSDLAHLTMMVKTHFARQNWPFEARWQGGQRFYFLDATPAATWRHLRGVDAG